MSDPDIQAVNTALAAKVKSRALQTAIGVLLLLGALAAYAKGDLPDAFRLLDRAVGFAVLVDQAPPPPAEPVDPVYPAPPVSDTDAHPAGGSL